MAGQYATFVQPTQLPMWQNPHPPAAVQTGQAPSQHLTQDSLLQGSPSRQPAMLSLPTNSSSSMGSLQTALRKDICALPTCQRHCFIDARGVMHNYCSRAHAQADAATRQSSHRPSIQTSNPRGVTEYSRGDKRHRPHNQSTASRCSCGACHPPQTAGRAQSRPVTTLPPSTQGNPQRSATYRVPHLTARKLSDPSHTSSSSVSSGPATRDASTAASISTLLTHGITSVASGVRNHYLSKESSSDIFFYHRGAPYFAFTNFAEYPIVLDGVVWPTSEHYFQAQKFKGTPLEQAIRLAPTARQAFNNSHQPNSGLWVQPDWDMVKDDVMLHALRAKFAQHTELRELLVSTGSRRLIEHTENDHYWADGGDGSGLNRLGQLLMRVRDELVSGQLR